MAILDICLILFIGPGLFAIAYRFGPRYKIIQKGPSDFVIKERGIFFYSELGIYCTGSMGVATEHYSSIEDCEKEIASWSEPKFRPRVIKEIG